MKPEKIVEDERPIEAIYYNEGGHGFKVGVDGVTRIEPYQECGEMSLVPWFAVYRGGHLSLRAPAHAVTVYYKNPNEHF